MITAVGKYVLLQTLDLSDKLDTNAFYIPTSSFTNIRLGKYKVLSVGSIAQKEYGVKEGSIVYADRLACLNWRDETPFIDYKSIIYEVNEDTGEYIPFKNMIIVESDEQFMKKSDTLFTINENTIPLGTVVASKSDMFNVNDTILLPSGGDVVQVNNKIIHIYVDKDIHCKCEP